MVRVAAITYDGLPLSSGGGHTLRTRGFRAGLEALRSFVLSVSVDQDVVEPAIEVVVGDDVPTDFTGPLMTEFDSRFLKLRERAIGSHMGHQWSIDASRLNELALQMDHIRPLPQAGYAGPPVVIHVTWKLVLVDPLTREKLPFQSKDDYLGFATGFEQYLGESVLYARISDKTTASILLCLPFEDTATASEYVTNVIQPAFPTSLSSKHWKIWRLTKAQNSYVGRKVSGIVRTS